MGGGRAGRKKKQSPTAGRQLRFPTGDPSLSVDLPVFCDRQTLEYEDKCSSVMKFSAYAM